MATAEQIGIMKLMGCELITRPSGDKIIHQVTFPAPDGWMWTTMASEREYLAWHDAAEAVFADRFDSLIPCFPISKIT